MPILAAYVVTVFMAQVTPHLVIPGGPESVGPPGPEISQTARTLGRLGHRLKTERIRLSPVSPDAANPSGPASRLQTGLDSPSPAVRRDALEALALQPDASSVLRLTRALTDPDPRVQETSLRLLEKMRSATVAEALLETILTAQPQEAERLRAHIPALSGQVEPHLLTVAENTAKPLSDRLAAVRMLGSVSSRRAIPALGALTSESEPQVTLSAAQALAASADARAIPFLKPLLNHPWPGVRLAAIQGLGRAGVEAAVPPLCEVAAGNREPLEPLRVEAIRYLGALGSRRSLPSLIAALRHPPLQAAAMQALRGVTGETMNSQPSRWIAWWNGQEQRPQTVIRSDVLPESANPLLPSGVPPEWALPMKPPESFGDAEGPAGNSAP